MGRRANSEGFISRRKDGRWMARYTVETPDGTKRKTLYGKTRKERQTNSQKPWPPATAALCPSTQKKVPG
jgi:hypothetical protein